MTDIGMIQLDQDGKARIAVLEDRPANVTVHYGYPAWAVLAGRAGARRYVATGAARSGFPLDLVLQR